MANIPGDSVDDGDVVFDLLFPLVLPEGSGDHRYYMKWKCRLCFAVPAGAARGKR